MDACTWISGCLALAATLPAQTSWMSGRNPAASPPGRSLHALAYDAARQRVVLFGGGSNLGLLGDTWEWDGVSWTQRNPAASPPARSRHAMAWDAARQRVLLFGGGDGSGPLADTWEWDGVNWARRNPATSPSARFLPAMACDVARQRVVLFGGVGGSGALTDTWEWNGTVWARRNPLNNPPDHGAMAHDAARQRTVLSLGVETWEWDGADWTRRTPVPGLARRRHAIAYDDARQRVVLFGGSDRFAHEFADTWEWDGATWVPHSGGLPGRYEHAMAWHAGRRRVVLFGGTRHMGGHFQDTWIRGDLVSAATSPIGSGCAGTNGVPLIGSGVPFLGNGGFALDLSSTRASAQCVFGLAASTQTLAVGGGCTLYLKDSIVPVITTANASGLANAVIPIPSDMALLGATVYAQGFVLDPMGSFAGFAFSAGLKLVLGD